MDYAVCSLLCLIEAGIHFVIPQEEAGKERGDMRDNLEELPFAENQSKQNHCLTRSEACP